MIFGDANLFAIEVDESTLSENRFANLRLLIGGSAVGSIDDSSMMSLVASHLLESLRRVQSLPKLQNKTSNNEILDDAFRGDQKLTSWIPVMPGDAFDDFLFLICHFSDDAVRFIWKLVDEPFFEYGSNYPRSMMSSDVPVNSVTAAISAFQSWYLDLK